MDDGQSVMLGKLESLFGFRNNVMDLKRIRIIQGGMGIHMSSWKLAKAVSLKGQLGVVSGTAIDTVVARKLQLGDLDGNIRRALDHCPLKGVAQRVKERFFVEGGKDPAAPFKDLGSWSLPMSRGRIELMIAANFVEVYLAREGHDGPIGINYLEKIQLPALPSLFGAMLAGVHVVLMGAGVPAAIPEVLDLLSQGKEASLVIGVESTSPSDAAAVARLDPSEYADGELPQLSRPHFIGIVSSDTIARSLEKRAPGGVAGYVIEHHTAGGHNAPPRRDRTAQDEGMSSYGIKDNPDFEKIRRIGKPFWLGGGYANPEGLARALAEGATGIQVGTPFAYSDESEMNPDLKSEVIRQVLDGTVSVETSFDASPTGYPFKLVRPEGNHLVTDAVEPRHRVCDMGYLRTAYRKEDGSLGWRCGAEPVASYVAKGGKEEDTRNKVCLCNGLMAVVGLGQLRKGVVELPVLTSGDELVNIGRYLKDGKSRYSASDVIDYILA